MAEMSTLNGYELVDSKLREDIDNLRINSVKPSCEDRLYEFYGIDKEEYPYVFIWIAPNFSYNRPSGNGNAYSRLVFAKQIEHVYGNYAQGYMLYHTNYYIAAGYDFPGDWNYNDEDITNDVIDKLCEVYPNLNGLYSSRDYASPVGAGVDGHTYLYINKIEDVIPDLGKLTYYDLSVVDYGGASSNPFAGCIPFPVNPDGSINYGTNGQILVTNADGTTAWTDKIVVEPIFTCEDKYYEFYGVDKKEYPYMILIDNGASNDGSTRTGMIAFVKDISDCSLSYGWGSAGINSYHLLTIDGLYTVFNNTNYVIWEDAERLSTYFKLYMEPTGPTLTEGTVQYGLGYARGHSCLTNSDEVCDLFTQYCNSTGWMGSDFCRTLVGVEYIP